MSDLMHCVGRGSLKRGGGAVICVSLRFNDIKPFSISGPNFVVIFFLSQHFNGDDSLLKVAADCLYTLCSPKKYGVLRGMFALVVRVMGW